jgi:hypothetical protein
MKKTVKKWIIIQKLFNGKDLFLVGEMCSGRNTAIKDWCYSHHSDDGFFYWNIGGNHIEDTDRKRFWKRVYATGKVRCVLAEITLDVPDGIEKIY